MAVARPRQIAYRTLSRAGAPGEFVEHRLESDAGFHGLPPVDRRLVQELVYGVLRQQSALDWLIARRTDGRPQKPGLQVLLRLGLYQLFWLDRIPPHAAVHETVEMARGAGFGSQSGFVNAVLRGCDRDRARIRQDLATLRELDPAVGWSHPTWLVERWRGRFGAEGLVRMLEWNNSPPPTFVRVNRLRTSAAELEARWLEEGVEAVAVMHPWLEPGEMYRLEAHPPLTSLLSFIDGGFYVQDPGTLASVVDLDPRPGETVLDWCAAPGGKTLYMAQRMENQGRVVAQDTSPERLRLVEENAMRLGGTCVELARGPGEPGEPGSFDRVLVDAPCSNTGVLRRRLELRWRLREEEITRLAEVQLGILQRASEFVRVGGVLAYSTCSVEAEENTGVVESFLRARPGFGMRSTRLLTPVEDGVDGAFVAVLVRTA